MQQPLEATLEALEKTIEETSFEIVEDASPKPSSSPETLEQIREKIKAARLEKLMARQLANELSANPIPESVAENITTSASLEAGFDQYREEEIDPRNEALIETIDNTSQTLNAYLAEFGEAEMVSEDDAESTEAIGIIESQTKQIELLEFLRDKEVKQAERLKQAIGQLERLAEAQSETLKQNRLELSDLSEKAQALSEENISLKRKNAELKESTLVAEQGAKALEEASEQLHAEHTNLQEKYGHLVKLNMEQQGKHDSNVMQLESDLKKAIKEIRRLRIEHTEMTNEIEASNKLVALQDQMITSLTIVESETLKV